MDLAVGAPGSTHDARFLRHTGLFQKIMAGQGLPNKTVTWDDYGEIPLVTLVLHFQGSPGWLKHLIVILVMKRKKIQPEIKQRLSCDRGWYSKVDGGYYTKKTEMKMYIT